MDDAENGGVEADSECKRRDDDECEARRTAKLTAGAAQVLAQFIEQAQTQRLAALLFARGDGTEFGACAAQCLTWLDAGSRKVPGILLDMKAKLVIEVLLHRRATKHGANPRTNGR